MEHSTGYVLFMYDAKFTNSGPYTCEVIVDTTFDTLMFTKKLLVIGKNSEFFDILDWKFKASKNGLKAYLAIFYLSLLHSYANERVMINLLRKEEKEINAFFNRISRVEKGMKAFGFGWGNLERFFMDSFYAFQICLMIIPGSQESTNNTNLVKALQPPAQPGIVIHPLTSVGSSMESR